MNENLDLTKILEGCPKYTPFYSQIFGTIFFIRIETCLSGKYIVFALCDNGVFSVDSKGKYAISNDSTELDCIVFPSKDQRDWSKFVRFWDKPKIERFDIHTFHPFEKVLFRVGESPWRCGFFSHIVSDDFNKELVCTSDGLSVRCVPYNDETKYLRGTTEDCPEYYKWWEKNL